MTDGPLIASIAALIGDPARANMLTALLDGRALTASELAGAAGVAPPTASGHLGKLEAAGLLTMRRQGRHRYFSLSGADVADVLEGLMSLAQRTGAVPVRTGPKHAALREARVCYDHLAGERGVALMQALVRQAWVGGESAPSLTAIGVRRLAEAGIDVDALRRGRRPICRACLDWSERRSHLGGALGAALLDLVVTRGWARRGEGRVVTFGAAGARAFAATFGVAT